MPTLFERLTGVGENPENIPKINIHAFKELLHDFNRGNITSQNIVDAFGLDAPQTAETATLYQKSNLASNKANYFSRLFGFLALAESKTLPDIYNETNFWAWINSI